MASPPFHVFYSYSHADARMLERLRTHLAMLRRHGLITEWYDRNIEAGTEWRDEIAQELEAADVIVLLVSADFLASDFCYEEEMLRAIERAEQGETTIIAVLLRPVDGWESSPFAKFQLVPRNARPITRWSNVDEAYSNIAASIRSVLEERVRRCSPERPAHGTDAPRVADLSASPSAETRGAQILTALHDPRGGVVIVSAGPEAEYYTQCFEEERGFWCEAVSNKFLDASRLDEDQMSRLVTFGWNPPGGDLPNWWCVKGAPEDVAALMVRTLNEVYGVHLDIPFHIEFRGEGATAGAETQKDDVLGALQELALGEAIIVSGGAEGVYYVQCRQQGRGRFWCEAVSNEFLDESRALDADQMLRLVALGWNRPADGDHPNWWCVKGAPEDVAALMVRTLNEVYGVGLDEPLRIETLGAT
jgi:hypothetical protein